MAMPFCRSYFTPPMISPLHRTRRAFTLTEILVAISIVGVLASIVLSTASRVRTEGYRVKCASNLRQINIAMQAYCAEHDGQLPARCEAGSPPFTTEMATGRRITFSPPFWPPTWASPRPPAVPRRLPVSSSVPVGRLEQEPCSQGIHPPYLIASGNVRLTDGSLRSPFGYPGDAVSPTPVKAFLIESPSKVPAMYDLDQQNATQYVGDPNVPAKPIHNGRRNIMFFDGHVET